MTWWKSKQKEINEPVLAILNAMKDVSRWNLVETSSESRCIQYLTDEQTGYRLCFNSVHLPSGATHKNCSEGVSWMNKDEKHAITIAAMSLIDDIYSSRNKKAREMVAELYKQGEHT